MHIPAKNISAAAGMGRSGLMPASPQPILPAICTLNPSTVKALDATANRAAQMQQQDSKTCKLQLHRGNPGYAEASGDPESACGLGGKPGDRTHHSVRPAGRHGRESGHAPFIAGYVADPLSRPEWHALARSFRGHTVWSITRVDLECSARRPSRPSIPRPRERANSKLYRAKKLESEGKVRSATKVYREILDEYPETRAAHTAANRIDDISDSREDKAEAQLTRAMGLRGSAPPPRPGWSTRGSSAGIRGRRRLRRRRSGWRR